MTSLDCLTVAIGGAAGSVARFALREWLGKPTADFPWATFVANVVGSFVLGIVAVACKERPQLVLLVGVGFCGGFTTFSTFSVETLQMIEANRWPAATLYVVGSVAAGLAGAFAGMRLVSGFATAQA
jgi:CrcB protein